LFNSAETKKSPVKVQGVAAKRSLERFASATVGLSFTTNPAKQIEKNLRIEPKRVVCGVLKSSVQSIF